jgi:ribose 5-phosphate isomerase B
MMPDPAAPGEKIPIASDHGGFRLKEEVKRHLEARGFRPVDLGCRDECSVDYPDYAFQLAGEVSRGAFRRGILICGTGIGMSMTANRVPGIRAALCHDSYTARLSREHNDANVLVLGGRCLGPGVATEMVDIWLAAPFTGGRHQRRVEMIDARTDRPGGEPVPGGDRPGPDR